MTLLQDWSKRKKITVITIGVLVLTSVAVLVWYFFIRKSGGNNPTPTPTPDGGCPKGMRVYEGKCVPDCESGKNACAVNCYDPNTEDCIFGKICEIDNVCSDKTSCCGPEERCDPDIKQCVKSRYEVTYPLSRKGEITCNRSTAPISKSVFPDKESCVASYQPKNEFAGKGIFLTENTTDCCLPLPQLCSSSKETTCPPGLLFMENHASFPAGMDGPTNTFLLTLTEDTPLLENIQTTAKGAGWNGGICPKGNLFGQQNSWTDNDFLDKWGDSWCCEQGDSKCIAEFGQTGMYVIPSK